MVLMNRKQSILYIILLLFILPAIPAAAQTAGQDSKGLDFFVAPLLEVINSRNGPGFCGGLAVGMGSTPAIGARFLYAVDGESINMMELAVFVRLYPLNPETCLGLFAQLNAGAVIFAHSHPVSVPAEVGAFSVSFLAGWRFLLGEHWFIEPVVRTGYPYLFGAGVSGGFRL